MSPAQWLIGLQSELYSNPDHAQYTWLGQSAMEFCTMEMHEKLTDLK